MNTQKGSTASIKAGDALFPERPSSRQMSNKNGMTLIAVDYYEATDAPNVLTAVLMCGHSRRYNVRGRGRPGMLRCRQCEQPRKIEGPKQ
jgi:hypothetical protein